MKLKFTAAERRFAARVTRLAATRAVRNGKPRTAQSELWVLLVQASHKGGAK